MKIFGSWTELVQIIFRKNSNNIIIEPGTNTGSGDEVTFTLPEEAGPSSHELVTEDSTQTLTNKTVVVASNTITTAASGNLTATELNNALAELQTDIDTRALDSNLTSHTGASTGVHGVTGSVVGTSDSQTLTNKNIDVDNNTVSNISDSNIKAAAAIDATKIANGTVTSTEFQYINSLTSNAQDQIDSKFASANVIDEDDFVSDSNTKVPTQQSTKAYIATQIATVASSGALYSSKSADYVITDVDNIRTVGVTAGATNRTIDLPTASDNTDRIITVKKEDSGTGTVIIRNDGGSTLFTLISQADAATYQSDGTTWQILSRDYRGSSSYEGLLKKNKYQVKTLASDVTTTTADITSLKFNGLTIGKTYQIKGQIWLLDINGTDATFTVNHDSNVIAQNLARSNHATDDWEFAAAIISAPFVATATTVISSVTLGTGSQMRGGGASTFLQITEINNIEATTDFT